MAVKWLYSKTWDQTVLHESVPSLGVEGGGDQGLIRVTPCSYQSLIKWLINFIPKNNFLKERISQENLFLLTFILNQHQGVLYQMPL